MKHFNTLFLIITISFIGCFNLNAQNSSTKKADKLFDQYKFVEAIEKYEKLVEKGNANPYVYSQLAEANYNIFNTVEAEKWYAKVVETDDNPLAETLYKYAQMLKANEKYQESNIIMQQFANANPSDARAKLFKANPNYLDHILNAGVEYLVEPLNINSKESDFGGTLHDGKLYITSARNFERKFYQWNKQPFLDIYTFDVAQDGYTNQKLLNDIINTKYHEGLVAFSPDGKTMYFSRESFFNDQYQNVKETRTKYSVLQLFKAALIDGNWVNVTTLPFNSNDYSVKNPTVSADGNTLYFASDMDGGNGMFDLYKVAVNSDGTYGDPVNLGSTINTPGQDMFPYITPSNVLYFSSNGHLGLGALDVFSVDLNTGKVKNVGQPINSSADDFAFRIDPDTKNGFVSSNREGGLGSDDVYAVTEIQKPCYNNLIVKVVNNKTQETISGATVVLKDKDNNTITSKTTDSNGITNFSYECETETNIEVTMVDFESDSQNINPSNDQTINVTIGLEPIEKIIVQDRVVLNPIYFDFDKSNITAQGAFELDKLVQVMNKYPDMIIKAESHTDNRGSNAYNQRLSERRAQSTVQYVISKGISSNRISGIGKGENQPVIDCNNNNCSKEQHQTNRRSEFFILKGNPNLN